MVIDKTFSLKGLNLKQYCIDYRNGGMGNTVLAHVLYATSQIDFDLNSFFSNLGDSHKIRKLNTTNLSAEHLLEHPDSRFTCILTLVSTGWEEILRHKMSYCKWMKSEPNLENYQNFFQNNHHVQYNNLWLDFYNNIRDSNWPECSSYDKLYQLPIQVQKEIKLLWQEPNFEIDSEFKLIEFLTMSYYDRLLESDRIASLSRVYNIGEYLSGNFHQLTELSNYMTWQWNAQRSQDFYHSMITANQSYIDWLNVLKQKYKTILETDCLDWTPSTWEFSFVLAKILYDLGKNPRELKWQSLNCFFDKKSLKLTQLIGQ